MLHILRSLGPLISVASITLLTLAVTRPQHTLWQLLSISPDFDLSPPASGQLLSFISVPLIFLICRALKPQTAGFSTWATAMLIAMCGEFAQATSESATFDWADILAVLMGGALTLLFPLKRYALANSSHSNSNSSSYNSLRNTTAISLPLVFALPLQLACYLPASNCGEDSKEGCDTIVWLTWEEIRADIQPEYGDTTTLSRPGKLLSGSGELIVVDRYTGFHVFDTSDMQNPIRLAYIPLPGVTDVTSDGDNLYANAFTDLVVLPIAALRSRTFEPGSEIRIEEQLWFSSRQFIESTIDLTDEDYENLLNGNIGIAIGLDYHEGGGTRYGEYISKTDVQSKYDTFDGAGNGT